MRRFRNNFNMINHSESQFIVICYDNSRCQFFVLFLLPIKVEFCSASPANKPVRNLL